MSHSKISFFTESITFTLRQKKHLRHWITETIKAEGKHPGELNLIFCSDDYQNVQSPSANPNHTASQDVGILLWSSG